MVLSARGLGVPRFWRFLLSKSQFVTLPIGSVGEDVRA
jgi:hypothetical protein